MEELPALELIANFGVGYDNIDVEDARELDVAVSNTPDVLAERVADAAVGLVLATLRRLPQADAFLRHRRWTEAQGFPLTTKVSGKRFGVLGLGKIGSATAHRLAMTSPTPITPLWRASPRPAMSSSSPPQGVPPLKASSIARRSGPWLGGAGLDAFAHEPAAPERLRKRDDVVLLPHIASGTREPGRR